MNLPPRTHKHVVWLARACTGIWFDWLTLQKLNVAQLLKPATRAKRSDGTTMQFGKVWRHPIQSEWEEALKLRYSGRAVTASHSKCKNSCSYFITKTCHSLMLSTKHLLQLKSIPQCFLREKSNVCCLDLTLNRSDFFLCKLLRGHRKWSLEFDTPALKLLPGLVSMSCGSSHYFPAIALSSSFRQLTVSTSTPHINALSH